MKKAIAVFAICITAYSCNNKSAAPETKQTDSTTSAQALVAATPSPIDGLWTGIFDSSATDKVLWRRAGKFLDDWYRGLNVEGDEAVDGEEIMDIKVIPAELRPAFYMEPLNGYYSLRAPNKISVIIDGINDSGQVTGKSICAGMERPLRGSYTKTAAGFKAELKEPGDNKNDGIFNLDFSPATGKVTGSWTSLTGSSKACSMEKTTFQYDAQAGGFEGFRQKKLNAGYLEFKKNPSTELLKTTDVENLTKPELTILRNLIYARHGYTFANPSYRNYFENSEWYIPYRQDIRADLTAVEKQNVEKLKSFEKYASDAYDEFGR